MFDSDAEVHQVETVLELEKVACLGLLNLLGLSEELRLHSRFQKGQLVARFEHLDSVFFRGFDHLLFRLWHLSALQSHASH